jgi:hypothetical protein
LPFPPRSTVRNVRGVVVLHRVKGIAHEIDRWTRIDVGLRAKLLD